jgi:AP endonuclease 2
VAIYTRNAVCAPIRAEEGITGVLCPPNSSTSFYDLPKDQQIGGYPSAMQLSTCPLDPTTLDSEGRCVILEFPAFVLVGVYSPANRDESRDDFRLGFLNALDARVRNLVAAGKRVFLTGDLNIIRSELDTANAEEQLRKYGMTGEEYVSTPARRLLNQLLLGGKVIGERDEGREEPVLWDICRGFHPGRKGMFTCWETKINARPGNFGSRIDYVLCSLDMKGWFCDSNIQEGLIGSDHCPVYATIKDMVDIDGSTVHIRDITNPPGMFKDGVRLRDWNNKDLLPLSAKQIPEFDRRRNIRDMFTKRPLLPTRESSKITVKDDDKKEARTSQRPDVTTSTTSMLERPQADDADSTPSGAVDASVAQTHSAFGSTIMSNTPISPQANGKRSAESSESRPLKRSKSGGSRTVAVATKGQQAKGQSSLKGFFKPKSVGNGTVNMDDCTEDDSQVSSCTATALSSSAIPNSTSKPLDSETETSATSRIRKSGEKPQQEPTSKPFRLEDQEDVIDPIVAKETWSRLLSKRVVPRCEHNEPCVSYLTKKPGVNCGRSFYMCPRPLGPSGQKEKNTQWRCGTFIWSSDWTGDGT